MTTKSGMPRAHTDAQIVSLLREYVQQGGQLVVAAGAEFDPAYWNSAAWLEGQGILPLPLAVEPIGEVLKCVGVAEISPT